MDRRIAVLIAGLAFVAVVRSDDTLKCYMCTSLTNAGCDTDPKAHNLEPVECTLGQMVEFQRNVQQHNALSAISSIFEVDNMQHYQAAVPRDMACAKMVFKVAGQDVTVRSCQTAKTENIDPCRVIQGKFSSDFLNLQHCDLCLHDACNSSIAPSPKVLFILLSVLGSVVLGTLYRGA